MGPGPSNPDPRVLGALALAPLGPLDALFTPILDDVQALARYAFHAPLLWSDELTSILFAWLALLGSAPDKN